MIDVHNVCITYIILYITFYVTTIMNIFRHKVWSVDVPRARLRSLNARER